MATSSYETKFAVLALQGQAKALAVAHLDNKFTVFWNLASVPLNFRTQPSRFFVHLLSNNDCLRLQRLSRVDQTLHTNISRCSSSSRATGADVFSSVIRRAAFMHPDPVSLKRLSRWTIAENEWHIPKGSKAYTKLLRSPESVLVFSGATEIRKEFFIKLCRFFRPSDLNLRNK